MDVSIGCCVHVINMSFRLSRVRGTYSSARARVRITRVHVFDKSLFGAARPPHVGQVGTLRLKHAVITEPFLREIFCGDSAPPNYCGA